MKPLFVASAFVALAACGSGQAAPSTTMATTQTTAPVATTVVPETPTGNPITVYAPTERGPYPVVVTVHGGAWVGGDPADMAALAESLSDRAVVFNVTYRTMSQGARFPGMVEDVACDIVGAGAAAAEYTSTPGEVFVVAHSAGAHLSALVTLAPDVFTCDGEAAGVDGFVGLAGPYDVTRLAILTTLFGATLDEAPELWAEGNPKTYAGTGPDVPILLVHGTADQVVPLSFSTDLATELAQAGRDVELIELEGVDHRGVRDPLVVGDLVRTFISDHATG